MCLMAALIAPHSLWPSTTTSGTPSSATPYSMLPFTRAAPLGLTTFPATRTMNRSPTPWSKISSGGTRESAQPTMMAPGRCPAASGRKSCGVRRGPVASPFTNRWLPSRSFRRTSSAEGLPEVGDAASTAALRRSAGTAAIAIPRRRSRRCMIPPPAPLPGPQRARRASVLRGRHPQQRSIASLTRADGVDGDHVDPPLGELAEELGAGTDSVLAADQERALGLRDLPLRLLRHLAERGRLGGNEVHLSAAALRKTREGDQVDAGLVEHVEGARAMSGTVRHHHLEVLHAFHAGHRCLLLETARSSWAVRCKDGSPARA